MSETQFHFGNDSDMDTLFRAIGFVVVQFGQAEQSLDLAVATIYHDFDGKSLTKKIPIMLSRKLEFLRKSGAEIPALKPFRQDLLSLASEFDELTQFRHDLVHGAIADPRAEDGVFSFAKLDVKDGHHYCREVRLDIKEFSVVAEKLIVLGRLAVDLAQSLHESASE